MYLSTNKVSPEQFILFVFITLMLPFSGIANANTAYVVSERFGGKQGLPSATIYTMAKDKTGFLWLGTPAGLVRYDGNQMLTYSTDSSSQIALRANDASHVFIDSRQRLWIGKWGGGIDLYSDRLEFLSGFANKSGDQHSLANNFVQTFFEDSRGNIWIGTKEGGLSVYTPGNDGFINFQYQPDEATSLSHNRVWSIEQTSDDHLWVATTDGLNKMSLDEMGKFTRFKHDPTDTDSLNSSMLRTLFVDKDDNLWIGSSTGFGLFDINANQYQHITPDKSQIFPPVNRIKQGLEGELWIATQKGFYRYDIDKATFYPLAGSNNPRLYPQEDIRDILPENSGTLWLATRLSGLLKLKMSDNVFNTYRQYQTEDGTTVDIGPVHSLYEDQAGLLWIGSRADLLSFDRDSKVIKRFDNKGMFTRYWVERMFQQDDNTLWLAGGFGLFSLNKQSGELRSHSHLLGDLPSTEVQNMLFADDGTLWLGTWTHGLIKLQDNQSIRWSKYDKRANSISGDTITAMLLDHRQNLWLGTLGSGVNRLMESKPPFLHYRAQSDTTQTLSDDRINTIFQSNDDIIWLGTGTSLDRLNEATDCFEPVDGQYALENNNIKSLLEDTEGNLWMGTDAGISLFNRKAQRFSNFTVSDGSANSSFMSRSAVKTADGTLYFGSNNGIVEISTSKLQTNQSQPTTAIVEVLLDNKPLNQYDFPNDSRIEFSYKVKSLKLNFAALDFQQPEKNRYSSYLASFDDGFNAPSNDYYASYTNLDPGEYVFHVRGSNNDGVWGPETRVSIVITPPWWKLRWVQILLLLIALSLTFALHRYRLYSLSQQKKALKNQVEQQSKALLKTQKQLIESEKNVAISELIVGVAHEMNTPIGISVTAASLVEDKAAAIMAGHADKTMKKSEFLERLNTVIDGAATIRRNLARASELIDSFKLVDVDPSKEMCREFYLKECLSHILISLKAKTDEHKVQITLKCEGEIELNSFPSSLANVVSNLVINALLHAFEQQENPQITIAVEQQSSWVLIEVSDNGCGISPDRIKRIFDAFYTTKRGRGGSGLGLHIVQNIVKTTLAGEIRCDSIIGEGTLFRLKLALKVNS